MRDRVGDDVTGLRDWLDKLTGRRPQVEPSPPAAERPLDDDASRDIPSHHEEEAKQERPGDTDSVT